MQNKNSKNIVKKLILGQTITIKFIFSQECYEKTGMIIKIDRLKEILYLPNSIIPFSSIVSITF